MTEIKVQIVKRDGKVHMIENVERIEVDKENDNRIKVYKGRCVLSMPNCDFTSIIVLRNKEIEK